MTDTGGRDDDAPERQELPDWVKSLGLPAEAAERLPDRLPVAVDRRGRLGREPELSDLPEWVKSLGLPAAH